MRTGSQLHHSAGLSCTHSFIGLSVGGVTKVMLRLGSRCTGVRAFVLVRESALLSLFLLLLRKWSRCCQSSYLGGCVSSSVPFPLSCRCLLPILLFHCGWAAWSLAGSPEDDSGFSASRPRTEMNFLKNALAGLRHSVIIKTGLRKKNMQSVL